MQISDSELKPTAHEIPKEPYQNRQYANAMIALFKRHYKSLPDDNPAWEIVQSKCGHVFSKIKESNFSTTSLSLQDYIDFSGFLQMDVMNRRSELNELCNLRAVRVADDDPVLLSCDQQNLMLQNFKEFSLAECEKFPRLHEDPSLHQWTHVKVHFIARKWFDHLNQHIYQLTCENNRARQNSLHIDCPSGIPQLFKKRFGFWIHKNYQDIVFPTQEEKQEKAALEYFVFTIHDMIGNMQAIDTIYKIAVEYSYRRRHPFWDVLAGKKFTQTQNDDMAFLKLLFFELAKSTCKRIIIASNFDRSFGHHQTRELRETINGSFLIDHHRCTRWSPARLTMTNLRRAIEQRMRFNHSSALETVTYRPMPSNQHKDVHPEKWQMEIDESLNRESYIAALTERDCPGGYSSGLSLQSQESYAEKYPDYFTHLENFPAKSF